jgi:spore coat polysaccharide biosynthesis predicted glycosyltransferase SpsG/RimJ/RimL family protein N-acetyltransferase
VAIDGYHFGSEYQLAIKRAGFQLLAFDDHGHAEYYWADIVLNQNLSANEHLYQRRHPDTRLLLGTRYALLRQEFLKWENQQRVFSETANKLLVTLGGGDSENFTLKVIKALKLSTQDDLEAIVITGTNNPYEQQIRQVAHESFFPIQVIRNVANMPELMAWADIAISAAGSTSWELAFMGVPTIFLATADNHIPIAKKLETRGAGINLGEANHVSINQIAEQLNNLRHSKEARQQLSINAQKLVDGKGEKRIVHIMMKSSMHLRSAQMDDCSLVWEWANDPAARSASFRSESISWDQHLEWFKSKINDPQCIFYIAVDVNQTPIGHIRFDLQGQDAIVSITIEAGSRGKGYGSQLIQRASQRILERKEIHTIHAFIKEENPISCHVFRKAGYREVAPTITRGVPVRHFVLEKNKDEQSI